MPSNTPPAAMHRTVAAVLLASVTTGLVASVTLLLDLLNVLADPTYIPSCSINPVLSCGSVMNTWQASVFGFANPILGVIAFAILAGVAVVALAGVPIPDWVWAGAGSGALAGVAFTHWLIYQSLTQIGALCPWCMVVWVVTLVTAVTIAVHLSHRSWLPGWVARYVPLVVPAWFAVLGVIILIRFWYFWQTLL